MRKGLLSVVLSILFTGVCLAGDGNGDGKTSSSTTSSKRKFNYFTVGLHGGWTQFYGDLRQYDFGYTQAKHDVNNGGGGLFVDYQLNSVIGFRANLLVGTLGGSKRTIGNANAVNQNVYFKSMFIDYTLNTTVNFVNLMYSDRTKDRFFTAYVIGGIGFTSFKSNKYRLNGPNAGEIVGNSSNPSGKKEADKFTTELVIPAGLGVKFRLSRRFDLGLEYTQRFSPAGDKLDATVGGKRGSDGYGYFNAFVAIKFGKQTHSKEWVNPFQALNQNMADLQANVDGLAKDADGDGVSDIFDKEENTPADVAVDGSGRALDTDGDGVPDYLDADPFTSKGARVDENGKELDSDNDGVADSQDIEPNTEAGALVNFQGKTITLENAGGETNVSVSGGLPSIYFKVNSARIDYWSSYDRLAEVAQLMKADKSIKIKVVGSCDKTGTEDYNQSLGEKRAQAAVDHLVKIYGIDAGRFSIASDGEDNPLSVSDEALNVNRRVDFIIQ
ncbi:MAG: OmpA family protein [Flavobacteriales bacterium]|nr:OmpA family protein [Flavobacteriales bacterium]